MFFKGPAPSGWGPWTYTLAPGEGWPLGPERDPGALDLQTWKAPLGQAQIAKLEFILGTPFPGRVF